MTRTDSGFAVVETIIAAVVLAAIAGVGYAVWHKQHITGSKGISGYNSPPLTTQEAPQIKQASDLNAAVKVLDRTNINSSNPDSSELSKQTSGF